MEEYFENGIKTGNKDDRGQKTSFGGQTLYLPDSVLNTLQKSLLSHQPAHNNES